MKRCDNQPAFPLTRSALALSGLALGVAGMAAAIAGSEQGAIALSAMAACGAASVVSLLPVALRATRDNDGVGVGFLIGTALRMALTLGAFVLIRSVTDWSPRGLGGWMVVGYILMLAAESALILRYLSQRERTASRTREVAA